MDLPTSDALDLEFSGGWLTVWFTEPEIRNPLTAARSDGLRALCAALRDRRDIRGVTFRGRGGVFCAGGDLKAFKAVFQGGADRAAVIELSLGGADLFDAVNSLPQVTVMAVEGAAMAGGFGLACCGDVVVAEASAKFALTETLIGLTPAQISPFVLSRLGAREGRRLMLTAATLTGEEARAVGLADEVATGAGGVDDALARLSARVLRAAPGAVAATKALILAMPTLDRAAQKRAAAESFADAMLSDEGREGVAAFVQKRKPNWAE
ncbi:MAG: enoyl-CoA hydratase-related protein [Pseudomonadota bacterium]